MTRVRFIFLLLVIALCGHAQPRPDATDARRVALQIASSYHGYRLRAAHWKGELASAKPQIFRLNLYAGNRYWFTLAAVGDARRVTLTLHDETGRQIPTDASPDGPTAACGFSAKTSGAYFLRAELIEGGAAPFCLLYSYQ